MNDNNPYQAPQSDLEKDTHEPETITSGPLSLTLVEVFVIWCIGGILGSLLLPAVGTRPQPTENWIFWIFWALLVGFAPGSIATLLWLRDFFKTDSSN
ncbi:MAG: drug/metabolite transporter (DMT)-like permease [Pirellulaceae bacterium]|jgi:drug/metabolite transporter (DMT)-like permease